MQAVQGGLRRVKRALRNSSPVKHKHMLFPPACSSPLITEDQPGSWPGWYIGQALTIQYVRYHSLSGTISSRLQTRATACYQPGLKVYVCWSVVVPAKDYKGKLISNLITAYSLAVASAILAISELFPARK
jgi:hypothetical protein